MKAIEDRLSVLLIWGSRGAVGLLALGLFAHSQTLLHTGLTVLLLTPVARVAFSTYTFWAEKDAKYAAISGAVLALLLLGVFYGL